MLLRRELTLAVAEATKKMALALRPAVPRWVDPAMPLMPAWMLFPLGWQN